MYIWRFRSGQSDDWNWGLKGAREGGHLYLNKLMIKKGANDWNFGLSHACF